MKKIGKIISVMLITTVFCVRPAQALMIDAAALSAKISEWVNKVTDATTKISQQVSQIKQMASQGFNKEMLAELAGEYAKSYGSNLLKANKMKENVGGTKEKNKDAIEEEKELYVNNKNLYVDEKIEIVNKTVEDTSKLLTETNQSKQQKKIDVESKKQEYEHAIGTPDEAKAYDDYMTAQMEYERLETASSELNDVLNEYKGQLSEWQTEKSKIGTEEDSEYVRYQERLDALESNDTDVGSNNSETPFIGTVEAAAGDEWDKEETIEKYELKEEDYKNFMKYYFYNPKELGNNTDYQTKIDAVTRNRRYLLINSAVHLLQVSATLRREIPVRTEAIDAMFQNTPQAPGELEAIASYSATRIESMKALLMYAKLQAARLQYTAARELQNLDAVKVPSEDYQYEEFDLGKYILTQEYVDQSISEAEAGNESIKALESKEIEAE